MSTTTSATHQVAERFFALRKQYAIARIATEVAVVLAAWIVAWVLLAALDYVFEFSLPFRRFFLATLGAIAVGWIGWRTYALSNETTTKAFAGKLESRFTGFGQRLRTILEAIEGRITGPTEMLTALGNQALGRWETLTPGQILPRRSVAIAWLSCLVFGVGMLVMMMDPQWQLALKRVAGLDAPYTQLVVTPQNTSVIEGEPIQVSLELTGRTNRAVFVRVRENPAPQSGSAAVENQSNANSDRPQENWTEIELLPLDEDGQETDQSTYSSGTKAQFATNLGKAVSDLDYQFVTSGGSSPIYRIEVQPLVDTVRHTIDVTPPAYTLVGPRTFEKTEVSVLAGSKVVVQITTSHPLAEPILLIGRKPSNLEPAEILEPGEDRSTWTFQLPAVASLHWRFDGTSDDGVPMSPLNGRLRVRRDQPPKIRWRGPENEIEVHTLTELPLAVDVTDDYGLVEAGVAFQLGDEEEFVLTDWTSTESDSSASPDLAKRLTEILPLESLGLSQFDFVSYYAYAVDNREGAPQRTESDIRYIDIRPLRQFYNELEPGVGGAGGGGFSTSVNEIIRRQRFLINASRRLVRSSRSRTDIAKQLGTVDTLVESQSELAGFVRFLLDRLAERGRDDSDALKQAEGAMLQAADSLAAADFRLAQSQQQEAMRALVEADDDLRQLFLGQMSAAQRAALARLAGELRQRLRLTPVESDQRLANSLAQLAIEQRELGSEVDTLAVDMAADTTAMELDAKTRNADSESDATTELDALASSQQASSQQEETVELSLEEQLEDRHDAAIDEQIALQTHLREIADGLSDAILEAELVEKRINNAMDDMQELATKLRTLTLDDFPPASEQLANDLVELAVLIASLARSEAVDRVSTLRDLTASLASMERELAKTLREQLAKAESKGTGTGEENGDKATDQISMQSRALLARIETTEEALRSIGRLPDADAGEVSERINAFVEEQEYLETIGASREVAESDSESLAADRDAMRQAAEQAQQRAKDLADAAIQLETIYRSLVAPKLETLRELEMRADELRKAMEETGDEITPEQSLAFQDLALQLSNIGMSGLANILLGGDGPGSVGDGTELPVGQLRLVMEAMRARIQEMILFEAAADRETPIPTEYRELVDRYFRALSGETLQDDR